MIVNNSLKIDWKKKRGAAKLHAVIFKDGDSHIIYIPSLNLSSYGDTLEESQAMMKGVVIPDFLETLFETSESAAMEELQNLGWQRNTMLKKKFSSEAYIDKNGILKDFNLEKDTQIQETTLEV